MRSAGCLNVVIGSNVIGRKTFVSCSLTGLKTLLNRLDALQVLRYSRSSLDLRGESDSPSRMKFEDLNAFLELVLAKGGPKSAKVALLTNLSLARCAPLI